MKRIPFSGPAEREDVKPERFWVKIHPMWQLIKEPRVVVHFLHDSVKKPVHLLFDGRER